MVYRLGEDNLVCSCLEPVGFCLKETVESIRKGSIFRFFLMMSIATIGAFAIREYPICCTVVGLSNFGGSRAKTNIKLLLNSCDLMKHQ
jgi:Cd2+/Zn2+-exporting ATPase